MTAQTAGQNLVFSNPGWEDPDIDIEIEDDFPVD
jgi:hypothetical protein